MSGMEELFTGKGRRGKLIRLSVGWLLGLSVGWLVNWLVCHNYLKCGHAMERNA